MGNIRTFRLIRSKPAGAVFNMAVDRKMFERYLSDSVPVFRVYSWNAPSLSWGVSQKPGKDIDPHRCLVSGVETAGRMTGGGILFHSDELTYSFVCSNEDVKDPKGSLVSYRNICAFLIRFYKSLGLQASFACEDRDFNLNSAPSAFCSASHEKYDIMINGRKIGGNAQKRTREVVFQHGSIPVKIDWEPVFKCLDNFPLDIDSRVTQLSKELPVVPQRKILEEKLIAAFGDEFKVKFIEDKEPIYETAVAE